MKPPRHEPLRDAAASCQLFRSRRQEDAACCHSLLKSHAAMPLEAVATGEKEEDMLPLQSQKCLLLQANKACKIPRQGMASNVKENAINKYNKK